MRLVYMAALTAVLFITRHSTDVPAVWLAALWIIAGLVASHTGQWNAADAATRSTCETQASDRCAEATSHTYAIWANREPRAPVTRRRGWRDSWVNCVAHGRRH